MSKNEDIFQALILREFLLEDNLQNEFNHAEIATYLGNLAGQPAALAVDRFLGGGILSFVGAGMTKKAITHLVQVKHTILIARSLADILALWKSGEDNYHSCCRSALCHAVVGSWKWSFGALQYAANYNDSWARHHHIYGLIHGAQNHFDKAEEELQRAEAEEPIEDAKQRIKEALEFARTLRSS